MKKPAKLIDRRHLLLGALGTGALTACGGGSDPGATALSGVGAPGTGGSGVNAITAPSTPPSLQIPTLAQKYISHFRVGTAVQASQLRGSTDTAIIRKEFNTLVAEYEMKADQIGRSGAGVYNWGPTDEIVNFAQANGQQVRGHALLWHQSTPNWMLAGSNPATIRTRLETYITDVVTRYRGIIPAWDVVNEVISDNPAETYRNSNWYQACGGPDFIEWAFRAARAADPNCQLFINDYSTENANKLSRLMGVVTALRNRGVPIDGVGHQFHLSRGQTIGGVTAALDTVANAGLINHITELDISIYSDPGSCFSNQTGCQAAITDPATLLDRYQGQALLYKQIFDASVARPSVTNVLVWGVHDGQSWLNTFPTTRANYPLLFDRNRKPKLAHAFLTKVS